MELLFAMQMSWYTKRLSLAAVYKASEIHMLQDSSPDYVETWEFLDRRIEGLLALGKTLKQVCTMKTPFWVR